MCVYNQERMLVFLAEVHNFTMFSELLLFTRSAQKLLSKLFCHTVISTLLGVPLGEYEGIICLGWKTGHFKFILKYKLRLTKVEVSVDFCTFFFFFKFFEKDYLIRSPFNMGKIVFLLY